MLGNENVVETGQSVLEDIRECKSFTDIYFVLVRIFNRDPIENGKWYYEKAEESIGRSFDHLDIGFGCFTDPGLIGAEKKLYRNIFSLLGELT